MFSISSDINMKFWFQNCTKHGFKKTADLFKFTKLTQIFDKREF